MKMVAVVMGLLLVPAVVWAQGGVATAPVPVATLPTAATPPARPPAQHSYRLRYTLTEFENNKQTAEQHLTTVQIPNTGQTYTVKLGSRVPIVTSTYSGTGGASLPSQWRYEDVGTTLNLRLNERSDNALELFTTVEETSFADPHELPDGKAMPPGQVIVRNAHMEENTLVKTIGEVMHLGAYDIPASTHRVEVSVAVERVN